VLLLSLLVRWRCRRRCLWGLRRRGGRRPWEGV